jgi:hypothetical protein
MQIIETGLRVTDLFINTHFEFLLYKQTFLANKTYRLIKRDKSVIYIGNLFVDVFLTRLKTTTLKVKKHPTRQTNTFSDIKHDRSKIKNKTKTIKTR